MSVAPRDFEKFIDSIDDAKVQEHIESRYNEKNPTFFTHCS